MTRILAATVYLFISTSCTGAFIRQAASKCEIAIDGISVERALNQTARMAGSVIPYLQGKSDSPDDTLQISVRLKVENGNDFDLWFRSATYLVFLGDLEIGGGRITSKEQQLTVKRNSSGFLKLPVNINLGRLAEFGINSLKGMQFDCRVRLKATMESKLGAIDLNLIVRDEKIKIETVEQRSY